MCFATAIKGENGTNKKVQDMVLGRDFSQNSQAAATRTCLRRGAMASLRQHVKMPPESVQEIRCQHESKGYMVTPTSQVIGVP